MVKTISIDTDTNTHARTHTHAHIHTAHPTTHPAIQIEVPTAQLLEERDPGGQRGGATGAMGSSVLIPHQVSDMKNQPLQP